MSASDGPSKPLQSVNRQRTMEQMNNTAINSIKNYTQVLFNRDASPYFVVLNPGCYRIHTKMIVRIYVVKVKIEQNPPSRMSI